MKSFFSFLTNIQFSGFKYLYALYKLIFRYIFIKYSKFSFFNLFNTTFLYFKKVSFTTLVCFCLVNWNRPHKKFTENYCHIEEIFLLVILILLF